MFLLLLLRLELISSSFCKFVLCASSQKSLSDLVHKTAEGARASGEKFGTGCCSTFAHPWLPNRGRALDCALYHAQSFETAREALAPHLFLAYSTTEDFPSRSVLCRYETIRYPSVLSAAVLCRPYIVKTNVFSLRENPNKMPCMSVFQILEAQ